APFPRAPRRPPLRARPTTRFAGPGARPRASARGRVRPRSPLDAQRRGRDPARYRRSLWQHRRLPLRVRLARRAGTGAARHLHDPPPGARRRRVCVGRAPTGSAPLLPRAQRPPLARAAARTEGSVVRLVSWNIHGGLGRDGRRDLGRIAALLEDMRCDVAALQEVGDPHASVTGEVGDHASWLGRKLGWYVAYGPNFVLAGRPYGNAILSRFTIA